MSLRAVSLGVMVAYVLITATILVWVGDVSEPEWWLVAPFLLGWASGPLAALWWLVRRCQTRWGRAWFVAVQLAMAGFSLYLYYQVFWVHPDPQGALIFLFVPVWDYAGVIAAAAVYGLVRVVWRLAVSQNK